MSEPWRINVFGVRHLSPAGAWHLRRYLDRINPELVLIEVLDRPGTDEDQAVFRCGDAHLTLGRRNGEWVSESLT